MKNEYSSNCKHYVTVKKVRNLLMRTHNVGIIGTSKPRRNAYMYNVYTTKIDFQIILEIYIQNSPNLNTVRADLKTKPRPTAQAFPRVYST